MNHRRLLLPTLAIGMVIIVMIIGRAVALDPPHDFVDTSHTAEMSCSNCHSVHAASYPDMLGFLCESCHYASNPYGAPVVETHSSRVVGDDYGDWDLDCWACHNPHTQEQERDFGYTDGSFIRCDFRARIKLIDPDDSGDPDDEYWFPIAILRTVTSSEVQFSQALSNYTDPEPDASPDDNVCRVCHQSTANFSRTDNTHTHGITVEAGENCTSCHSHRTGFAGYSGQSHDTHLTEVYGPQMSCVGGDLGCHGAQSPPMLADGSSLVSTTVCDTCHSPGGQYDGVDDAVIGARLSWHDGVHDGGSLRTGKEQWCAGCHDDVPAVVLGVSAPNVIGDEDLPTVYGLGAGYYVTGHGLGDSDSYPSSGGTVAGADLDCVACHDVTGIHVDGVARTYDYQSTAGGDDDYQHGFRLRSVGGGVPMVIPRLNVCSETDVVKAGDFALCLSCHGPAPFTTSDNFLTNFRRDGTPTVNAHYQHLSIKAPCGPGPVYRSDWGEHTADSRASCVTCHNVHGSSQLAMIRDGSLVGDGLEMLYYNDGVSYSCFQYPTPANVTVDQSTGTIYRTDAEPLCRDCHGSCGFDGLYLRSPF